MQIAEQNPSQICEFAAFRCHFVKTKLAHEKSTGYRQKLCTKTIPAHPECKILNRECSRVISTESVYAPLWCSIMKDTASTNVNADESGCFGGRLRCVHTHHVKSDAIRGNDHLAISIHDLGLQGMAASIDVVEA